MRHAIELKRVGPRDHVRRLLEERISHLEEKVTHVPQDAVSLHVVFEENKAHRLYRTSLTCHVPGRTMAAHEEHRDAGTVIRKAFAELGRQLQKQKTLLGHERIRTHPKRRRRGLAAGDAEVMGS